jgi:hypothetical protein
MADFDLLDVTRIRAPTEYKFSRSDDSSDVRLDNVRKFRADQFIRNLNLVGGHHDDARQTLR